MPRSEGPVAVGEGQQAPRGAGRAERGQAECTLLRARCTLLRARCCTLLAWAALPAGGKTAACPCPRLSSAPASTTSPSPPSTNSSLGPPSRTMPEPLADLLGVAACLLLKNLVWYSVSKRKKKQVGQVEQIVLYPVKSCRGVQVQEAEIVDSGLRCGGVRDRSYLIYSADTKRAFSLKNDLPLSEVQPQFDPDRPGGIVLTADGHPSIPVQHTDSVAVLSFRSETISVLDCGDKVAAWLQRVCGKADMRLGYCPDCPRDPRPKMRQLDRVGGTYGVYSSIAEEPGNRLALADKSPILLLSSASLRKLNEKLSDSHGGADWRNFRPNIVTSAAGDGDEDRWGYVWGDSFALAGAFPCERCPMVNIDHTTPKATKPEGQPVIEALRPFRTQPAFRNPLFGVCCTVQAPGPVRVGEKLFADA